MLGLGSLLGAVGKVGGALYSSIAGRKAYKAYKKQQDALMKDMRQKNDLWYNRRYNEVGTERADAQAALSAMREAQSQRMANMAGRSAVMGGSNAQAAAERNAQNKAMGDVIQGINTSASNRKDTIESNYMAQDRALDNKQMELNKQMYDERQSQIQKAGTAMGELSDGVMGAGGVLNMDVRGIWNKKYR